MTITYPRLMPVCSFASSYFEPDRVDLTSPETGGRIGAVTAGSPLWEARFETHRLHGAAREEMRAWLASMRGAQKQFYGSDPTAPAYPRNYRLGWAGLTRAVGGAAFDGNATSWARADDSTRVVINGLPSPFGLQIGDYIGFVWSPDRRALLRCVEGAPADGAGSLAVSIEPAIPLLVPANAVLTLNRPTCLMRLMPGTEMSPLSSGRYGGMATIVARQELLP